jgi:DNA-binding transcriptional LysR family regulator
VTLALLIALDVFVRSGIGSASVADLEDELGLRLADAEGRPTRAAVALADRGRAALEAVDGFFACAEALAVDDRRVVVLPYAGGRGERRAPRAGEVR